MSLRLILSQLRSQYIVTIPVPEHDFSGQTVIVTGSNVGLGLEAARHFVRLHADKVILAVRTAVKGEAARRDIEASTGCPVGTVEMWELDLCCYASVIAFAKRAEGLERLDVAILNASLMAYDFQLVEQDETTITVNVVSTFLLALLLLPILRRSAARFATLPHLTIVSSDGHLWPQFPEKGAASIYDALNDKSKAIMMER